MKIHPVLLFCVLSALQDGNILINAIPIFTLSGSTAGFTVVCPFTKTGNTKYFCKDECKENILEMDGDSAERDKFRMKYKTTQTGSEVYVTIKKVTKSDSGLYTCGLDNSTNPYRFKLIVGDASSISDGNLEPKLKPTTMALPPTPPRHSFRGSPTPSLSNTTEITTGDLSVHHTTSNPDFTSDSPSTTQSFRRSLTPSSSSKTTNQQQNDATTGGIWFLYLVVTVIVVVVLLAVFLPLLYKWKKRRSSSDLSSRVYLTNMESVIYENSARVSTLEESGYENVNPSSIYQTLNLTTMAHDQTYSTLGQPI